MNDNELAVLERLHDTHWWYQIRKFILKQHLSRNLKLGSSILEIGSATGGNTQFMLDLGYQVTSLEYSSFGVDAQRAKGIPVIKGDARTLPFSEDSFDAVVCMDVLEHIQEDSTVLSEIYRVLKRDGFYLISVPEDPSLWSAHDIAADHVRRYELKDLLVKVTSSHLSINSVWRTNFLLKFLVRWRRKSSSGNDLNSVGKVLNNTLLLIAYIDYLLSSSRISGVTIWVAGSVKE
jgi:SAM-dependent methyltransferase